jgi:hypothetical protein
MKEGSLESRSQEKFSIFNITPVFTLNANMSKTISCFKNYLLVHTENSVRKGRMRVFFGRVIFKQVPSVFTPPRTDKVRTTLLQSVTKSIQKIKNETTKWCVNYFMAWPFATNLTTLSTLTGKQYRKIDAQFYRRNGNVIASISTFLSCKYGGKEDGCLLGYRVVW